MVETHTLRNSARTWLWLGPMLYMLVAGAYFTLRFGGLWAEQDSAVFTQFIRGVVAEGQLVPASGDAYPNGYGYQAISAYLLAATGVDVATLQQIIYPLLSMIVVLPAWALYRELVGSARGATIATMLLLSQPEFLFVVMRSSHEKFTRTLLLLCLYLLIRSFKLTDRPVVFAMHVALFYLSAYAFIASNNLLAHSFIFAVGIALILGWVIERRNAGTRRLSSTLSQRLPYAIVICLGLVYLFTFYAYPPAQHDLLVLQNVWDRIAALFLDVQSEHVNAYSQVSAGWVSLPIYLLVSSANWFVLVCSLTIWLRQGWRWLRSGEQPEASAWITWLFYAAFAAQGVLSVAADASGALGSNLQHRIFPSISIIAVVLVARTLDQCRPQRYMRFALPVLVALGGYVGFLSILKATNEPIVSNKWTFYQPTELRALHWADESLENEEIWTDLDERLAMAFVTTYGSSQYANRLYAYDLNASTRILVVSDIMRLRSDRLNTPIPLRPDPLRVYDNGEAQVYRLRPTTAFQR